jgi:2-amino-4-hydroxy-6-hydroxymethyldihydropteridine diphosphokinase
MKILNKTFFKKKRIIFGLGSNLGDRNFYLDKAVQSLVNQLFLGNLKKSKIFKNAAMLLPNSPTKWNCEFFNIALSADINLKKFPPLKILEIIKKIEKELGRQERSKWAPREIDIDILAIENLKISLGEKLTVPHKGLFERDFFIKTVLEIEPELLQKLNYDNTNKA